MPEIVVKKIRTIFFFNATPTAELYTLSLHDALPISLEKHMLFTFSSVLEPDIRSFLQEKNLPYLVKPFEVADLRSEEHTSELQSRVDLVCRLLLEKKNSNLQSASARNTRHVRLDRAS